MQVPNLVAQAVELGVVAEVVAHQLQVGVEVVRRHPLRRAVEVRPRTPDAVDVGHMGAVIAADALGLGAEEERQHVQVLPQVDAVVAAGAHRSDQVLRLAADVDAGEARDVALDRGLDHHVGTSQVGDRPSQRVVLDLDRQRGQVQPRRLVERQAVERAARLRRGRRRRGRRLGRGRGTRRRGRAGTGARGGGKRWAAEWPPGFRRTRASRPPRSRSGGRLRRRS